MLAASNGAAYLPATLAAIEAQSVAPDRLIAVDGGSKDDTRAVLEASRAASWASLRISLRKAKRRDAMT